MRFAVPLQPRLLLLRLLPPPLSLLLQELLPPTLLLLLRLLPTRQLLPTLVPQMVRIKVQRLPVPRTPPQPWPPLLSSA